MNNGETALWWARHGDPHPHPTVIAFLQENGSIE